MENKEKSARNAFLLSQLVKKIIPDARWKKT